MKTFTIRSTRERNGEFVKRDVTGTIPELIKYFSYTLLKGQSWQNERGNKKINMTPRTAQSLVTNLNNAERNATMNGCPSTWYDLVG